MDVRSPHPSLPAQPRAFDFFVDGAWVRTGERKTLDRLSPGHDIAVTTIALCTGADVDHAVRVARQAFEDRRWSGQSSAERAAILLKAAQGIRARAEELALLETLETGKPISQSRGEIEGAASIYEYAAGAARMLHGENLQQSWRQHPRSGHARAYLRRGAGSRRGISLSSSSSERVPFILAAGCTDRLSSLPRIPPPHDAHHGRTSCPRQDLPAGVFNVVTGLGAEVGQAITRSIPTSTWCPSPARAATGRRTLQASAGNFKKLGLELGGKNPQIVFADADLEDAADGVVFSMCFNAGQCCVGGSRAYCRTLDRSRHSKSSSPKSWARVRVGDPLDPAHSTRRDRHRRSKNDKVLRLHREGPARLVRG